MRLHSLDLQAFGPYAAAQHVDFDLLARSGLFLLEGPTGAGKSTILDAITFALYGGLAGDESGADRLHSDFAAPGTEPSVTLEFSLGGVRYRICRVPEHERPKKRGQGCTTAACRVHLQRRDTAGWTSLSSNKAEAADLITDKVGLNREQFTQVMLLPQGEFARFLRCDDDDRRAVLTRLFGTQLYDRITAELDQRRGAAAVARQDADAAISTAVAAAAEAAGLDAPQRGELLALTAAERAVQFKQIGDDLAATVALTGEALQLAGAQLRTAAAGQDRARLQAGLMSRLTEALARLAEHESGAAAHEQRAGQLAAARQADPVRPLLAALAETQSAVAAARDALPAVLTEARSAVGRAAAPLAAGEADRGPVADLPAGPGGSAAAARAAAAEAAAAQLQYLVDAEATLPGRAASLAELQEAAAGAAALAGSLTTTQRELPGQIAALTGRLAAASIEVAAAGGAQAELEATRGRHAAAVRLAELEPLRGGAASAAAAAVDAHQQLVDAYQRLMATRLAGMAAELAAGLARGAGCPVCGSTEHPAPAQRGQDAVSEQDMAAAAARRDGAQERRRQAQAGLGELDGQVSAAAAVTGGLTADSLTAALGALAARIDSAARAVAAAELLAPELAGLLEEQQRVSADLVAAATAAEAAAQRAGQAQRELAAVQAAVDVAAHGHPSAAARQRALRRAARADRALAAALDALAAAVSGQDAAHSRATGEALGRGFATLELASQAALAAEPLLLLETQVVWWNSGLAALRSAAAAPDLAGLDPADADAVHAAARQADAAACRAQDADREARSAWEAQLARAERLRARLSELAAVQDHADAVVLATDPVIYLAALAKGMGGHRRVALTTYVLRRCFEQVVAAANVRLAVMSSGRYELRRSDAGETRRQRGGLMLSVLDRHTGEERGPRSLSGGETFYTSLALALGLADVVKAEAGGVDLDTLFIDEGFGSLDPETLDQVLGVIDDLRDRGRVVGIVSHVADLKDRIPERLEVRRRPDGSSAVRVVA